ncbi:MAG: aminotransferase class I/II-fold pyridoxal phosphate-dependent enzyme [Lachnospiraceae bacterium]|nr:aminotransferase class I/II-fold pyridoxal phosphate-dependent enzyme [Lachnospiraceae bacterium]
MTLHGGDIYSKEIEHDFSVNLNPMGVPDCIVSAIDDSLKLLVNYPDILHRKLKKAIAAYHGIDPRCVVCGNGASELISAVFSRIIRGNVLIPMPSYDGYRYAAMSKNVAITYHLLDVKHDFTINEDIIDCIEKIGGSAVIIVNPNNPTGKLISPSLLENIISYCKEYEKPVLVDESYIELTDEGEKNSCINLMDKYDNLMIIRSFTKAYSMPGIRLGYLMCSNTKTCDMINYMLPEWNISTIAEYAGIACLKETSYLDKGRDILRTERPYLKKGLSELGMKVMDSDTCFLLFSSDINLDELLLKEKILIRSLNELNGLKGLGGYFRIGIKKREENDILLNTIKHVLENRG